MSKVAINISGPSGAGKSLIAHHFAAYLRTVCRIEVTLNDDGQQVEVPTAHEPLPPGFKPTVSITVEQK